MAVLTAKYWRNGNFLRLWAGQSIALFGSSITTLALPLAAINQLAASPIQMGVLQMASFIPFLLFGLLAGVWVDRLPRRPVLIAADLGRAAALGLIPLAAVQGWLRIELLFAVAFAVGTLNLLFEAAYAAFLPAIVPAEDLQTSNSRLQASAAAAEIAGPGIAGWLAQTITAAIAIVGNTISFIISALLISTIRVDEPAHRQESGAGSLLHDMREGLRMVIRNPYIRALSFCSASANIFINMHLAIYVLYLTRSLGFSAGQIGTVYMVGSIGGLVGAWYADRIARRMGLGRAILVECLVAGIATIAIPLASLAGPLALLLLALFHALWNFWTPVYVANAASLRQHITPNGMLGRVTSASRFISWGAAAVGFLLGGVAGERLGLLPTLLLAGVGVLLSTGWIFFSPVRSLRDMPQGAGPAGS